MSEQIYMLSYYDGVEYYNVYGHIKGHPDNEKALKFLMEEADKELFEAQQQWREEAAKFSPAILDPYHKKYSELHPYPSSLMDILMPKLEKLGFEKANVSEVRLGYDG